MSRSLLVAAAVSAAVLTFACASTPPDDAAETAEAAQTATWGGTCAAGAVNITNAVKSGGSFHGATSGSSVGLSTCGDRTGPAKILAFDLPGAGNYRVDVTSALPASDPSAASAAVVVRSDCTRFENEIACNPQASTKSTFVGYHVSGPVYIRIEGAWFSSGFDVKVTKLPLECMRDSDCTDWPDGKCNQLNGNCISHLQCRGQRGNCDRNWDNGCEADLSSDAEHCGACGATCDTSGGHASAAACKSAVCEITCDAGFANCDGRANNGCEANLASDGLTCGACGTSCGGGVCAGGACASHADELAQIPGMKTTGSAYSINRGLRKIALSQSRVIVMDDAYSHNVWSVPRSGGAPVHLGSGEDFAAAPASSDVWTVNIRRIGRVSELGGDAVSTILGNFEEARVGGTDGTDLFLFEEAVASSPRTAASIRTLAPGASATSLLWSDAGSASKWATPSITSSRVVGRSVGWSGYAYNAYYQELTVLDRATGAVSSLGELPGHDVSFVADDTGVWFGADDGVYFAPYGGGAQQKVASALRVSSIAVDATHVYYAAGDECGFGTKLASRIYALPKAGGAAREIGYDVVGRAVGSFDGRCGSIHGNHLAVDGSWVYWISEDRVRRIAK